MEPGGFPGLQNQCDLTTSGWVGSIPMHSRQCTGYTKNVDASNVIPNAVRNLQLVICRFRVTVLLGMTVLCVDNAPLAAQQRDTAVVDTAGPRPELRPPLSPRRAFLYSLAVPGYAQSVLGRNKAGALELAFEAVSLVMIRISAADVREARRAVVDSIPVSFVNDEGVPTIRFEPTPFTSGLLRSRRARLEDWIAVLLANHLFSAADAYVSALLWDLPAEVSIGATPQRTTFGLRFGW
jgi:hypothetical protein